MLDLSVVIITKDEEARIARCLESLPAGAEVVVLDSGSADRTADLAKAMGARVQHRPFDDYSSQKNAALAFATRTWVLSIDADEVLTPGLAKALASFFGPSAPVPTSSAYRLRRRLVFMGRVMRFGKTADAPIRLFRRGSGAFVSSIHETFQPSSGKIADAPFAPGCDILHYSYENLTDYFEKFNRYTSRMATQRTRTAGSPLALMRHILRPHFEFCSRYFLRLGFLDGYPGYCYALLSSLYAFVKYAKAREP